MKRWIAVAVAPALLFAGAAAYAADHTAHASQTGGLSISPALIERTAQPGPVGTVTVTNRSTETLALTVTPRPWTQAASGQVAANRRGTLAGVHVSQTTFTLAPQAAQKVAVTLAGVPAGGALYGALEVVGIPSDAAKRSGVIVGYRLVGTLRLLPAQKKLSLTAGAVKRVGRAVVLPVTNGGNTLDPITGVVQVKGARGTLNDNVSALKILPGKKVNIVLGTGLRSGSYNATVTLKQGGAKLLSAKRKFSVR